WDANTEVKMFCLFVNGGNNVYQWSGGMASFASVSGSQTGVISAIAATPQTAGVSYSLGDLLFLSGGSGGQAVVTGVDVTGAVLSVLLQIPGSGYSATNVATTTN